MLEFKLIGHVDSDWVGSLDDRKSTIGWVFNLGSGAVSWSLKKQEIAALSSTKAENVVVTSASWEGV